ncbi:MAG: glutamyl-tRNA reductase [Anaerovoracaceae bacterium]
MQIKMVGIDHNKASLEYRELFSFTTNGAIEGMKTLSEKEEVSGCLILSTCNRTELWVSGEDGANFDVEKFLCEIKGVQKDSYDKYFVSRNGKDAIEHLLVTACGINSKVFGEDQIITQIKDALELSSKNKCADRIIEKVFQNSITAAKKVKTSVKLTSYNPSVASSGVKKLENAYGNLKDKKCLIIGNGKMGELIAKHLLESGAEVMMTLRKKYHHGEEQASIVPKGCQMVPYEDRITAVALADIVVSATLSPHFTICKEDLKEITLREPGFWLDLAVPRDIDPAIGEEYNITICDIDGLGNATADEKKSEDINRAKVILANYRDDIEQWLAFRKLTKKIDVIAETTAKDTQARVKKEIKNLELSEDEKENLKKSIEGAASRAVNKLLCELKDTLPKEHWEVCLDALLLSAKKETVKK